jgi:hypothetical protein
LGRERSPGIRRAASSVVILAAIFLLSYLGVQPPLSKPADAPSNEFSSERAIDVLGQILDRDAPHPVGGLSDDAVRMRIVDELARFGYNAQVQTGFACSGFGNCATVNNILARLDGSDSSPASGAVLVAAHYDSVPAGPGASDDGSSVAAVLEIARIMKVEPQPKHSVIFLVDEGEEAGLLGARAFVDWHPWAKDVRAVVNLDARGTSGASLLFETGTANQWTIRLFKSAVRLPVTSSIFYEVYKALPEDTDMTVFKSVEKQGANFAYIGNAAQYHTPLDNLANVNPRSVQHQGENGLAMARAFANADLSAFPERQEIYFDVFGRRLLEWPASRALGIAFIAALLLAGQIALLFWTKRMASREFLSGLVAFLMALVTTGALSVILQWILRLAGATPVSWIAHPLAARLAFWLLALSVVVVHGIAFAKRAGFWGLWAGVWTWWAFTGLVLAWLEPGMSYLIEAPVCVALAVGLIVGLPIAGLRKDSAFGQWLAGIFPMAAAATVGFPTAILLYSAMGTPVLPILALFVALILTPLIPLCVDLSDADGLLAVSIPGAPILATGLAIFAAVVVPAYSAQAPERVNMEFWQDGDSGKAQWVVEPDSGKVPEPIAIAAPFHTARSGDIPWSRGNAFLADAPALDAGDAGAPTFTVLDSSLNGERRQFSTLLRSERGAPVVTVFFPPDSAVDGVRMEDVVVPPEVTSVREYFNGWFVYSCPSAPARGVELTFTLPVGKPVTVTVVDHSYGLPDEGAFLVKARPLTAVPSGEGDVTVLSRRVQLNP